MNTTTIMQWDSDTYTLYYELLKYVKNYISFIYYFNVYSFSAFRYIASLFLIDFLQLLKTWRRIKEGSDEISLEDDFLPNMLWKYKIYNYVTYSRIRIKTDSYTETPVQREK